MHQLRRYLQITIGRLLFCNIMAAVDWSTLPLDLLGHIAMRLETMEDFIYFSAVCPSWNRASSSIKRHWRPIRVPWLLLAENTSNNPHGVRKIFNPSNNKCYKLNIPVGAKCWGSDYGWVAMVDRNLDVRLFNPITKAELRFPSVTTIPDRIPYNQAIDRTEERYITWFLRVYMRKLVVLKVSQNEFVIAVIYDHFKRLAFAKQGDKSWTSVFVKEGAIRMFDVVAMDGYVFALYNDASLVYWNIEDFQGHELVKPMDYSSSEFKMFVEFISGLGTLYLVQSGSDLLMVLRFKHEVSDSDGNAYNYDIVYETFRFLVYRLDPKDRRWEEIKDHATLFVGGNSTMCVSAKGLQPNYIYFTDDELEICGLRTKHGRPDMSVYDIKREKKWQFYDGEDIRSTYCTPTWFIPQF